jgi:hypothetical protein
VVTDIGVTPFSGTGTPPSTVYAAYEGRGKPLTSFSAIGPYISPTVRKTCGIALAEAPVRRLLLTLAYNFHTRGARELGLGVAIVRTFGPSKTCR